MKKFLKYFVLFLFLGFVYIVYTNYPRLNVITGFSSKSVTSVIYVADRTQESAEQEDNNFSPINSATNTVNSDEKSTTSTLYGLKNRTAVYREGLGAVLINDDYDKNASYLVPNRDKTSKNLPFPYGDLPQKDTVFTSVDYQKLQEAINNTFDIEGEYIKKTRSVLVVYKGQIVAEKYADGFDKNSLHLGWSMTKSLLSTVYGVLNKQGKISVNDPAPIEAWKNDARSKITINNLLQMNSGLEWIEDYNTISDVTKMLFLETDMTKSQIDKPFAGKPNETWNYSSGTSNLLSGILRQKFNTHQEYLDFWYTDLIDKIGMHSMIVEADLAGNYVASSYAWATTRDWAKFGLLYLNKGNWNGEQIISKDWVNYVATPTNGSNGTYGAQFWLNVDGDLPDVPHDLFYADGYQGQRVFIIPSKDIVVVRMGLSNIDFNTMLKEIIETIK